MTDTWPTAERLAAYRGAFAGREEVLEVREDSGSLDGEVERREMGAVQIVHARSDRDISWRQTGEICAEVLGVNGCEFGDGEEGGLINLKEEGMPRFRVQVVEFGGEFP